MIPSHSSGQKSLTYTCTPFHIVVVHFREKKTVLIFYSCELCCVCAHYDDSAAIIAFWSAYGAATCTTAAADQ